MEIHSHIALHISHNITDLQVVSQVILPSDTVAILVCVYTPYDLHTMVKLPT